MNALRRNRIGKKWTQIYSWEPVDVRKMTGPLAVQEYILENVRSDSSNIKKIIELPQQIDLNQWKYEHTRQIVLQMNLLVTTLKGICTAESCPKMKESEEKEYHCMAHKSAKTCSAIEYMAHNLDEFTSILLNSKAFSSRTNIGDTKSLESIFRRLVRMFGHTYYYHKETFDSFEKDMHLYERFITFGLKYGLLNEDVINIPRETLKEATTSK